MSCFICEIPGPRLFNVKLSQTSCTNTTYSDLIRTFVWKSYEFEIFDEDAVCQTCCTLLEELDRFYSKSREIESILMTQICRKYQVDVNESPVYAVNEQQLQLFSLIPFAKSREYRCHKCSFATAHADCLVPHYKLHDIEENGHEDQPIEEYAFQCRFCDAFLADENLLEFHVELFHTEKTANESELDYEHFDVAPVSATTYGKAETDTNSESNEYHADAIEHDIDADDQAEVKIEEIVHLRCPVCAFCCIQQKAMDNHVRAIHGRRSFKQERPKCQFCDDLFDNMMSLVEHSKNHPEISFKCCVCDMTSAAPDDVLNHFKLLHMKKNVIVLELNDESKEGDEAAFLKCNQCGKDLGGDNKCSHFGSSADDPQNCSECDKKFDSNDQYVNHLHTKHFKCDKCPMKCNSYKSLQAHFRRRHTKYPCPHCDKLLGSTSSLQAHLTIHGLNAAYKCTVCDKGFKAKSLYETHLAIHTREYNYTCHICGQKFIHQRSHRIHVQWHDNPRPHKCPHCEKTYKHRSHLAVHRRSHFGERPNGCPYCERRFTSASKLKVHMVVHTGIFSHPCQVCGKGFMKRYKLAEHLAKVHDDNSMLLNKPKCEYKLTVRPDPIAIT